MILSARDYFFKFFKSNAHAASVWRVSEQQITNWKASSMIFIVDGRIHKRVSLRQIAVFDAKEAVEVIE